MSEEIIYIIEELKEAVRYKTIIANEEREEWKREYNALQGLLDLYRQEKEKNKELEEENQKYPIKMTDEQYKDVIDLAQKDIKDELERQINTRMINEEFIEKNYISKDKIKKIQCQLIMQLGSYVRDEASPEQERIAGGINIINKILKGE